MRIRVNWLTHSPIGMNILVDTFNSSIVVISFCGLDSII